jgi:hypothetical protein
VGSRSDRLYRSGFCSPQSQRVSVALLDRCAGVRCRV